MDEISKQRDKNLRKRMAREGIVPDLDNDTDGFQLDIKHKLRGSLVAWYPSEIYRPNVLKNKSRQLLKMHLEAGKPLREIPIAVARHLSPYSEGLAPEIYSVLKDGVINTHCDAESEWPSGSSKYTIFAYQASYDDIATALLDKSRPKDAIAIQNEFLILPENLVRALEHLKKERQCLASRYQIQLAELHDLVLEFVKNDRPKEVQLLWCNCEFPLEVKMSIFQEVIGLDPDYSAACVFCQDWDSILSEDARDWAVHIEKDFYYNKERMPSNLARIAKLLNNRTSHYETLVQNCSGRRMSELRRQDVRTKELPSDSAAMELIHMQEVRRENNFPPPSFMGRAARLMRQLLPSRVIEHFRRENQEKPHG